MPEAPFSVAPEKAVPHVVDDARAQMATAAINGLSVGVPIERLETPPKGVGG